MYLTHKTKLYPTEKQRQLLVKTAGCCRFAYNWAIDEFGKQYKEFKDGVREKAPNDFSVSLTWTKEKPSWADEVSSTPVRRALRDAWTAYKNAFKQTKWAYPTYKKKSRHDSFYMSNQGGKWYDKHVRILRVGIVRTAENPRFTGKIIRYTISREGNDWFVATTFEVSFRLNDSAPDSTVGVDVGLEKVAITSDSYVLNFPTALKNLEQKKKFLQRKLDKAERITKEKNGKQYKEYSRNGQKKLSRLRKVQSRINNIRRDVTHKYTTAVCKSHATVVIEDLCLTDAIEKSPKSLLRAYSTSLMRMVLEQFRYKAKSLIKAPRFFASSKTCSKCGSVKKDLSLSDRIYKCPECGLVIDRDYNAALNLMKTPWVTGKAPVEASSLEEPMKQEDQSANKSELAHRS